MTNMFALAEEEGDEWEKDFSCFLIDLFYVDHRSRLQLKVRGHIARAGLSLGEQLAFKHS